MDRVVFLELCLWIIGKILRMLPHELEELASHIVDKFVGDEDKECNYIGYREIKLYGLLKDFQSPRKNMDRIGFLELRLWIVEKILRMLPHELEELASHIQDEFVDDEDDD